jgi:glycosyltransferase involved in cell wall biosynthesis
MSDHDMAHAPTIWMNVTTSANWNRPPVGIVRVEEQLFQALSSRLGNRLKPCVLSEGQFVHHSGPVGAVDAMVEEPADHAFVWPDPSFDFPGTATLEPAPVRRSLPAATRRQLVRRGPRPVEMKAGDTLISVGLDWDWENQRLDRLMYELKNRRGVNVITCCYDLIPILFPQYCVGDVAARFQEYFTNLTWSSSGMLCISRQTQSDYLALSRRLGMPPIPTTVMLLGNKLPEGGDDLSDNIRDLSGERFILFVSTIERRKNHEVLYKALHLLAERGQLAPDLKLVFVGMPGWGVTDLLKDIELDPLTRGHIVQVNHANDAELRRLYESCEFFVYPSFYEGWGLPVAEALALGKFVLASNRGSIPEIAGGLIDYVDPWNASAWAEAISTYWNDSALLAERTARVKANYRPISWDDAAEAVLDLAAALERDRPEAIAIEPGYDMSAVSAIRYAGRIVSSSQPGLLCHGPYIPLGAGHVAVDVELEVPDETALDLHFVFAADKGRTVLKRERKRLRAGGKLRQLSFELEIDRPVENFELVIEDHAGDLFSLNAMTVRPLQRKTS